MFRLISRDEFSPQLFEEYPVWSEHYDYFEIEEIVSWGIERDWLQKELKEKHRGNKHCYYPLLDLDCLYSRMRAFIKVDITTKNGKTFSGYVVNEEAYAVGFFIESEEIIFNKNMPLSWQKETIKKLEDLTRSKYKSLFPLFYETDSSLTLGKKSTGVFRLKKHPHLYTRIKANLLNFFRSWRSRYLGG
ncbi:MAG: hypothetical protein GY755_20405 [Chloroflexi bacterium]|nr:hypothetical protein [Chloroflexota bacterium]